MGGRGGEERWLTMADHPKECIAQFSSYSASALGVVIISYSIRLSHVSFDEGYVILLRFYGV